MTSPTSQAPAGADAAPAAPAALQADALSASLTVRDVHASAAWYRDALGFRVDREVVRDGAVRAIAVSAGNVRLMLNQDDGAKGQDRAVGQGFSMMLTTKQSVDDVAERITSQGGALEMPPTYTPWGMRALRVRDPNGFTFVVASPRA